MAAVDDFYSSPEWRELRDRRLELDGHRCTVARLLGGQCRGRLHVHHVAARATHPELALVLDNTGTSCASHHPLWEAVARTLRLLRLVDLPACKHRHPYREGRLACERRRRDEMLARRVSRLSRVA